MEKELSYKVVTSHPTIREYNGENIIDVSYDSHLEKWYSYGVWGCSKMFKTPEEAVMSVLNSSGTKLISKELIHTGSIKQIKAKKLQHGKSIMYFALIDGDRVLLRTSRTRYVSAALHTAHCNSKFDREDIRGYVTFHKTPSMAHRPSQWKDQEGHRDQVTTVFEIQHI